MTDLPTSLREAIAARGSGLSILVIRLGAMGDIVRTLPAVRLVRSGLPDARIQWVAWDPWTELLKGHPDIDQVIGLPRSTLRRQARSPVTWWALARSLSTIRLQLRGVSAGLVLDFHGDARAGVIALSSGAPVRLGYAGHQQKEGNRLFTTHRVPSGPRRTPRLSRNLDLVSALGLATHPVPDAGITIGPDQRSAASELVRALFGGDRSFAVLNPGASRRQAFKKPPAALFAAAAKALARRGVPALVVCGPGEERDAESVVAASGGLARRAPSTTLTGLAALLGLARVFVGGDSGPLHLACGVGCPVVGLYGPTDPIVNTPWNVPFVALTRPGSAHTGIKSQDRVSEGFDGLRPDDVAKAIDDILDRRT